MPKTSSGAVSIPRCNLLLKRAGMEIARIVDRSHAHHLSPFAGQKTHSAFLPMPATAGFYLSVGAVAGYAQLRTKKRSRLCEFDDPRTKESPNVTQRPVIQAFTDAGHTVSHLVARAAAQPLCQAAVIILCIAWWSFGLPTDALTASLSILAITLTQMVLNSQSLREEDDRRRDVAMHAKLDELLRAEKFARKELAGIEELESEEIAALKLRLAGSTNALDNCETA